MVCNLDNFKKNVKSIFFGKVKIDRFLKIIKYLIITEGAGITAAAGTGLSHPNNLGYFWAKPLYNNFVYSQDSTVMFILKQNDFEPQ